MLDYFVALPSVEMALKLRAAGSIVQFFSVRSPLQSVNILNRTSVFIYSFVFFSIKDYGLAVPERVNAA